LEGAFAKVERVKTGIDGLDEMLNGGIPRNHHVVVCGGPGTGKTTFGTQYLYKGAKDFGETGAYITLEEQPDKIIEDAKQAFPQWTDFQQLLDQRKINFVSVGKRDFTHFLDVIQSFVTQHNAKRVVIDSSTILELYFGSPYEYRQNLFDLLDFLGRLDCTVLIIAEHSSPDREKMTYDLTQFLADGVILLYNLPREEKRLRGLEILKMRGTDHSHNFVPMKFSDAGIVVFPEEKVY